VGLLRPEPDVGDVSVSVFTKKILNYLQELWVTMDENWSFNQDGKAKEEMEVEWILDNS
jgi:hypothetical protein